MFRKFLVFFLSIVTAAAAIGAGWGIGVWEATDDDGATATVCGPHRHRPVASTARSCRSTTSTSSAKDGVVQVTTQTRRRAHRSSGRVRVAAACHRQRLRHRHRGPRLTNQHVVDGAQSVTVTFANGDEVGARRSSARMRRPTSRCSKLNSMSRATSCRSTLGSSKALKIGDPSSRSAARSGSRAPSRPASSARSTAS